jgi:hypothetical protein
VHARKTRQCPVKCPLTTWTVSVRGLMNVGARSLGVGQHVTIDQKHRLNGHDLGVSAGLNLGSVY